MNPENDPEWGEFVARMKAEQNMHDHAWRALPPLMRAACDNVLSPWVKVTHKGRIMYARTDRDEWSLRPPPEGVSAEGEVGSSNGSLRGDLLSPAGFEIEYSDLGGPGSIS